ncbi:hypothetical protein BX661DRAFT_178202 [Kickxella alabastrina]|uniref:uncharacterized protein n=1 Tax=Kickxella alabastrina TaxID=61397 RepID=UPI00221F2B84|nr:uncharacterized protein BX661DRAFT_178202 [Kickxella alabastrina]KAI7833344.1 hypothetical protein BX661DRAFT_178202 [Kickxella alabastrina]
MSTAPRIKACLFDMDGLLLDTEIIYTEVTNKILEPFGKIFPLETKLKMMGRDVKTSTNILLADLEIPLTFEEYDSQASELKTIYFREAKMMPGVEKLIRHLAEHSIPIAVATSSSKPMFLAKTTNHGDVFSLFGGNITCGDDPEVKHAKPAPDIFLTAMRRLDSSLLPEDCLVFEDATNGIEAANNAHMNSIWVHDMRFSLDASAPKDHNATERITSLVDFVPEKYGLPPFKV